LQQGQNVPDGGPDTSTFNRISQDRVTFYIHVTVHRNKFLFNNQPDA